MALAINLDIVGLHLLDDRADHRARRALAHVGAVWPGVEIEMNAQKRCGPWQALRPAKQRCTTHAASAERAQQYHSNYIFFMEPLNI
jgi:hypothetical protein